MSKKLASALYTFGKYGKGFREICDTGNPFLYSWGRYPTKMTEKDLTPDYIKVHSRSIWYMTGFVKMSGIVDMDYSYCKENHLFKDDYIYISYTESLLREINRWGLLDIQNEDIHISGNDIIDLVLAAEKFSHFDTSKIRTKIEEKRIWLRDNEPDEYKRSVGEDRDIISLWVERGYVDQALI